MADASLVWLRNDLRVADNPALTAAVARGAPVHALYVEETDAGLRPLGAAARWWLHRSLQLLSDDLAAIGVRLHTRQGPAEATLFSALDELGATAVFWNRRYAPAAREIDGAIKTRAEGGGITAKSFAANVLVEPFDIQTGGGKPYSVYTPFWRALRARDIPRPRPVPDGSDAISPHAVDTDYKEPDWAQTLAKHCAPGEAAARNKLAVFLDEKVREYPEQRDIPSRDITSGLSPHLRFGEISPRQIWHAATALAHRSSTATTALDKFLAELAWRDFNIHQLFHRANIAAVPMREKYAELAWRDAPAELKAWQRGQTGIPIVDAGMRELWATGIMHNRVRMLVASLLTKNMLVDWRAGEAWFWDTLVDADEANNPGNWQWVAGIGLDAAPYFRIFNPVTQGERYDPDGSYVRRWVPELADLPDKWVHKPADAPADVLEAAGVRIGTDYPVPVVDLKSSRERALEAYRAV